MSWEQQNLPDNLKRFHFTVVGGFAHGWRIPYSNGLRGIQFVPDDELATKGFEHVAHIFGIQETGGHLVVFAPVSLPSEFIARFLIGEVTETFMKSFSVRRGEFELSGMAG